MPGEHDIDPAATSVVTGGRRQYRLIAPVGGAGTWQGALLRDDGPELPVAVDLVARGAPLPPDQVAALGRLARRLADTRADAIDPIVDLVHVDGRPGLVTAWSDGAWLSDLPRPVDGLAVCGLGALLARGLAAAHGLAPPVAHGNLHRGQLWISDDGQPRLRGFGLGAGFVAPSPADDVYALGGMLYELATGSALPLMPARPEGHDSTVAALAAELPFELSLAVLGCLAFDADARPSAIELVELLEQPGADARWRSEWAARPAPELEPPTDQVAPVDGPPVLETTPVIGRAPRMAVPEAVSADIAPYLLEGPSEELLAEEPHTMEVAPQPRPPVTLLRPLPEPGSEAEPEPEAAAAPSSEVPEADAQAEAPATDVQVEEDAGAAASAQAAPASTSKRPVAVVAVVILVCAGLGGAAVGVLWYLLAS